MTNPPQTPEDKAAKREARQRRELERIQNAGRELAATFPPLTHEQIERLAFILAPCVAAPAGTASSRPKIHANDDFDALPHAPATQKPASHPKQSKRTSAANGTVTVYKAEEVAQMLRCDVQTVRRWARGKKIGFCPMLPGQRTYRFRQKHIDDFLNGIPPEESPQTPKPTRHPKYGEQ